MMIFKLSTIITMQGLSKPFHNKTLCINYRNQIINNNNKDFEEEAVCDMIAKIMN